MLCIVCGKEEPKLHKGLCYECFCERAELLAVPESVVLDECAHCHSLRFRKRWARRAQELIANRVARWLAGVARSTIESAIDQTRGLIIIKASGQVDGVAVEKRYEVKLKLHRTTCTKCARRAGGYYESIVQLRCREPQEFQRVLALARKVIEKNGLSVVKKSTYKAGIDFYVETLGDGNRLARWLHSALPGSKMQTTKKLVGIRDGKKVYRVTHLVRACSEVR